MPRVIMHREKLKKRLDSIPPEILREAMPQIVQMYQRLAKRFAPKRTGLMASKIEASVERHGFVGWVIPRGNIAHLVHNPVDRHDIEVRTGKTIGKNYKAMRFGGHSGWGFATKVVRPATRGRPFLQMALDAGEPELQRILAETAERAVDKMVGG